MNTVFRTRFLRPLALFILTGIASAVPAHATLLVYEGFNGYATGVLEGQTPNANTVGLDQTVGYYDGAMTSRAAGYTIQSTGLSLGSLQTSGGSLSFASTTNVIGADLAIGSTAYTGTLWSSYLVNLSFKSGVSADDGAVLRVGTMPSDSTGGHFNSWADSRSSSANIAVGYGGSSSSPVSTNATTGLTIGTTYIIISSFTRVGLPLGSSGNAGLATIRALNESQFADFIAAGGDEAALAGTSVTATATNTITSGTFTFSSSDAFALITKADTGTFDEIRYGSTLADVTPTAIPEPAATAAIMGIGCGLLLLSRRQSRSC